MIFNETLWFKKDFKKLKKRYSSLYDDFCDFKKVLELNPTWNILISNLWKKVKLPIYKVKRFACRSLKSKSKIRLIYIYDKENFKIIFLEIYSKSDKTTEDTKKIINYFK